MEKAGIWVPDDRLALSDDELDEEQDAVRVTATTEEESGDSMDEVVEENDYEAESNGEESDEDWIITSPKLERMKMNGIC